MIFKRHITSMLSVFLILSCLLTACGNSDTDKPSAPQIDPDSSVASAEPDSAGETAAPAGDTEDITLRIGSLSGPTSIGLVSLMEQNENGDADGSYTFQIEATADVLLTSIISGDLDVALIPANSAAIWYQKFEGDLSVIDINTLGVLYCVSDEAAGINSIADLEGRTIYLTGKGTTPEYVLEYLLAQNGLDTDTVTLEFCSEATEVLSRLAAADSSAAAILPQPYATAALKQMDNLTLSLNLSEEWDNISNTTGNGAGRQVTGVTVVRTSFLNEHTAAIDLFLAEHAESVSYVTANPAEAAELVVSTGIIEKAAIAEAAIPYCNLVCITGREMQEALTGYLNVLYEMNPESVGGAMPEDDFYYIQ